MSGVLFSWKRSMLISVDFKIFLDLKVIRVLLTWFRAWRLSRSARALFASHLGFDHEVPANGSEFHVEMSPLRHLLDHVGEFSPTSDWSTSWRVLQGKLVQNLCAYSMVRVASSLGGLKIVWGRNSVPNIWYIWLNLSFKAWPRASDKSALVLVRENCIEIGL